VTRGLATILAITASTGAGLIHLALGPEHLEELGALGWGFYVAAALQVGWVAAVVAAHAVTPDPAADGPRLRAVALAGIAMNVAILGAWVVSRTVGLPTGETPWVPEAIGRADLISAALEIGIVAILAAQWRTAGTAQLVRVAPRRGPARLAAVLSFAAIVAGTAIGLAPDDAHAAAHDETQGGHVHTLEVAKEQAS
jgi:hypothetical protein